MIKIKEIEETILLLRIFTFVATTIGTGTAETATVAVMVTVATEAKGIIV